MTTAAILADPYTVSFVPNGVTLTWGSGLRGPVTFDASNIDYKTFSNTRLVTISSGHNDDTTVDSTVATNTGGFASAALLIAYITANIIPAGSVVSISQGQGLTCTPDPITGTGTVAVSNLGITAGMIASNAVTTAKINNGAVTYAKQQNVTDARLLGNATGGAAAPSEITVSAPLTLASSTLSHATSGVVATSYASPSSLTVDATGHVTAVTAVQNVTNNRLLGNASGVSAPPSEIGVSSPLTMAASTLSHATSGVTANTYAYPSSVTVNGTGHVTAMVAGYPQLMFRAMLVNPSTFAPTASPEVFPFSNYINPSGYFDQSTERFTPPANGYYLSCINYQLSDMSFPLTDPGSGFSNKFSVYVRRVGTTLPLQIITSYPKVTQLCGSNTSILSLFSIYQYEMVFRFYTWNDVDLNPTGLYNFSSNQAFSSADNGTSWAIMKLL